MVLLLNKFILLATIVVLIDLIWSYNVTNVYVKKHPGLVSIYNNTILWLFCLVNLFILIYNQSINVYIFLTFQLVSILTVFFKTNFKTNWLVITTLFFNINLFILKLTFLNFIIFIEINSLFVLILILFDKNIKRNFLKKTYVVLITTNIVIITMLILNFTLNTVIFKCISVRTINFLLYYSDKKYIMLFLYITTLTKLGLFIGPKYNKIIYESVSKNTLFYYMLFSYNFFIFIFCTYLKYISISPFLFILIWFGVFLLNCLILPNTNKPNLFFYWSNQINLVYLQFFLI